MIELLHTDCMEYMKGVPDKFFDLAIVDPPYGIGVFTNNAHTNENGKRIKNKQKYATTYSWNDDIPAREYFEQVDRISKKYIIWGANYYNCFNGGAIIWYKGEQTRTVSACEIASVSWQNKVDYVHINWQSGFFRKVTEGDQIHPCQKPVKLYKWLLKNYAKEGDKIFDSHLGSGSIAIACHDMKFDLTGCEIDKDYYDAAVKRFENHKMQLAIF